MTIETLQSCLPQPLISFIETSNKTIKDFVNSENFLEVAKTIIEETNVLVVIGYSFPFFNRDIDNEIFKTLTGKGKLMIYFQDPLLDGNYLKEQFNLRSDVTIKHIPKIDQFYIPYEL